jgi:hypothetical protein
LHYTGAVTRRLVPIAILLSVSTLGAAAWRPALAETPAAPVATPVATPATPAAAAGNGAVTPVAAAPAPVAGPGLAPPAAAPAAADNGAITPAAVAPAPVAGSGVAAPAAVAGSGVVVPPAWPAKRFPRLKQPSLVHLDQFGLAVLPGSGYRIIAPYQDQVPCGQQNKRVCTGWIPFFIDVQPSFGVGRRWDVIVDLRFGVAADFSQSHQFAVAPGFRYWVDPELPAKFFATFQGVYDVNPQHDVGVRNYDIAVRNANGFMFEVMRDLGFYLQFGETLGFVRWLRFEVDGGVGVQARFP